MVSQTEPGRLIQATHRVDLPTLEARVADREPEAGFTPTDILHAIRRRGWWCLAIAIPLSVVLATGVYMLQKPTYLASALLQLSSREQSLVFNDSEDPSDYEIFQATQRELVGSRYVMMAALRNEELAESALIQNLANPVDWMLAHVRVETPEKTEIMKISASADTEDEAVMIVNAVVDAYLNSVVNRNLEIRQKRLADITNVLAEKQLEVRNKRNELRKLVDQLGSSDSEAISVVQQLQVQEIGSLRSQLIDVHQKTWSAEARLKMLQAPPRNREEPESGIATNNFMLEPTEDEIDAALAENPIYAELVRDKLTAVRLNAEAKAAFKSDQPSVYANMKTLIDEEIKELRQQVRDQLTASAPRRLREIDQRTSFERQQEIDQLTADLAVFGAMESRIDQEIRELEQAFGQVGNQSIDVEMMRSEIAQLEDVVGNIKQQSEELEVEINSRPRVELLVGAENARVANGSQRLALAGFAGMFALGTPIMLLIMLDLLGQRVNSSTSLAARTGLPIIGTIPLIPPNIIRRFRGKPNRRTEYWQTRLSESVKRISSRLLAQFADGDSQVLLVTSAQRKEGRTTLATQLALSLGNTGRTVLLVDFDLRRPSIHRVYGMDASPGVCELLRGEADLQSAVQPTGTPNLCVLPAGECCGTALQALGYERTVPFFRELRETADFVIIDGCPVLTSSDVGFICLHVDQVIMAARRDVSRITDIRAATEFIRNTNTPVSGAVVIEPDEARHVDQFDRLRAN
jgi:Mrp family chromosome partitioning ATPase/uncharacterized protein involved in exopolysaccharide biosynthesis